ncbi:unnamed protein product [Vicia faba]|uniref:Uncharacterized protein n=1 Tax=Vicia faba TaxID=3906 RepID=A0AAV1B3B9_VICFA|nr:unnamed protein product [Vicia faba]
MDDFTHSGVEKSILSGYCKEVSSWNFRSYSTYSGTLLFLDGPKKSEELPSILWKTLEELMQESIVVRTCLDNQDERFIEQAGTNSKITSMLEVIMSRLSPPPK